LSAQRDTIVEELRARATDLGFSAFGIAPANARPDLPQKLALALQSGWHADMEWMDDTKDRRESPKALWPDVKSVIMVGVNYGPDENPLARLADKSLANVSVYAQMRDYHEVIKGRLKDLAGLLARRSGAQVKVFVDTAPVMEKPLAEAAGLGWQGKHTVLLSRDAGSWLFLGAIFTSADLPVDQPEQEKCGTCTKCLDICPTDAFPAPFRLDARKCLAYYSVEHKGQIPLEFRRPMGNRVFGCDDCLAVCPWNKFATATRDAKLSARETIRDAQLSDMLALNDSTFRDFFAQTPVKRLGSVRFLRNCLIAAGNSGDRAHLPAIGRLMSHESPLVRGMAIWALRQLADASETQAQRARTFATEPDPEVRAEWSQ
jgi:epoxyqueuosine reductase